MTGLLSIHADSLFTQFFLSGGPIVWFVLLPMSLVMLYLGADLGFRLRRAKLLPPGRATEIATLAGAQAEVKGVESISHEGDSIEHAKSLANNAGCTVVVTGVEDIITDGRKTFIVKNGHPRMGEVVGTGCMAASVIGAFIAIADDITLATANAMVVYGIAGELAGHRAEGPGTMKMQMFDTIMNITPEDIRKGAKVDVQ